MQRFRTPLLALAAVALVAVAPSAARAETGPAVTAAHLRISMTTSSDWARIRIEGATFPVTRVVSTHPGVSTIASGDGWTMVNHSSETVPFVVDTLTSDLTGRSTFRVIVEQGLIGSTSARVDDARRSSPLVQVDTGQATVGHTWASRTLSRAELLGTDEIDLPHADPRQLALAVYYPWFKRSGNETAKMAEEPLQSRSAWDLGDVRSHVAQARSAGIDGFAVSWGGQADDGPQFDLVLQAMAEQGGTVVPYLETARATSGLLARTSEPLVAQWLDEALTRAAHPAFLKGPDGIPVVMVFAMERLSADRWQAIAADSTRRGRPVHLVGDADPAAYGAAMWGWHRYDATAPRAELLTRWASSAQRLRGPHLLDSQQALPLDVATVSPGYDDTNLRGSQHAVVYRGSHGERYEETWDVALKSDPDWVLLTSWNEWFEGTSIEPGTISGDLALHQTAARIAAWKGLPAPVVTVPTTTTTTTPASTPAPRPLPLLPWWPVSRSA